MVKVILFSYTDYDMMVRRLTTVGFKVNKDDLAKHGSFTFDIQSASRAFSHQMVRHRLASFSQQSQRYVKITRSYGYLKPPSIPNDLKLPVRIQDQSLELTFEDLMDITRQVEEGYVKSGIKAEDARYVRPNASTTNVVTSMNPRQLYHVFELRCAPDAQWEIRCVSWAMFACTKLIAPSLFERLPDESSPSVRDKNQLLNSIVDELRQKFDEAEQGSLFQIPLDRMQLEIPVETFVRKRAKMV